MMKLTLIQAQERYIERVKNAKSGHVNRVRRAARKQLGEYLEKTGASQITRMQVVQDADDMIKLEANADD